MEPVFILTAAVILLVYALAFGVNLAKHRPVRSYVVFLGIQFALFVLECFEVGYGGGSDAMGNALSAGLLHVIYLTIQLRSRRRCSLRWSYG